MDEDLKNLNPDEGDESLDIDDLSLDD